jgi:uncharacterized protein
MLKFDNKIGVIPCWRHPACADPCHQFWSDDASLLDVRRFNLAHVHGHRQLTDLYLLGLAVGHGGRLVTFDEKIPLSAVHGAKRQHLLVF